MQKQDFSRCKQGADSAISSVVQKTSCFVPTETYILQIQFMRKMRRVYEGEKVGTYSVLKVSSVDTVK